MEAATAGPPERTRPATGIGGVPLDDPQRHRAYIAAAQRDLNRHLARLGSPVQLAVDGVWDEHCERAFVQVCRVLGLAPVRNVRTFRLIAGAAASRSDAERALARSDGAAYERELREHYAKERRATTVGAASLSEQERSRAYVATLQRDLNAHLQHLGVASSIDVDGEWDQDTARAFRQVCRVLGLTPERSMRTFRLISGAAASATKAERARASSQGSAYAERLREESPGVRPVILGDGSLSREERRRAYVAALQRDLNRHLELLGSPAVLGIDGVWGEHTVRVFRRVCRVLGVKPERTMRTFRVIAGALAPRTQAETHRASSDGKAVERALRRHHSEQRTVLRKDPGAARPSPREAGDRVAAAIRRHGGRFADHIVTEARRSGVPVSLVCAVMEQETGFSNVFGHDNVRNPIKSPPGSNMAVSEALYKKYLGFRKAGLGNQGVGPMQLTSPGLQDRADQLGGCWKPGPNIRVGVEFLAGNIKRTGSVRGGLIAYNGSSAYAAPVLERQRKWEARLAGARGAGGGDAAAIVGPDEPRTFRLTQPRMTGPDVTRFQRMLNIRLRRWKINKTIAEDGEFGRETRLAARQVAHGLGLAKSEYEHGITPAVRALIRKPSGRTAQQRAQASRAGGFRKQLRGRHAGADVDALLRGFKRPKPEGLIRIIVRGHEAGVVVTSTNDGRHAPASYHYQDRAVDFGVPGPLVGTAEGTRRLVAFQRALARNPAALRELFGPDNAACVKNGSRMSLAEGTALENQHDNHVHVAM